MNLILTCRSSKCKTTYAVPATDPQLPLLKRSGMRCPNAATCKSRLRETGKTNLTFSPGVQKITALELYQACMGVGAPEERRCAPIDVKKVIDGAMIISAHTEASPDPKRTIIHSLVLDNGKVLHFAASTRGATIFKITEGRNGR